MRSEWPVGGRPLLTPALAMAAMLAVATLVIFGYSATRQWQRSTVMLIDARVEETADRLVTALARDMRSAQELVLASRDWRPFTAESVSDITDQVAAAFASYPYPESFFGWRQGSRATFVFFNRANRFPSWMPGAALVERYPVVLVSDPPVAAPLLARIHSDAAMLRRYSTFETTLNGELYQIVARLQYQEPFREQLESFFGFSVNLNWVRRSYFAEITEQVARIGNTPELALAVMDERDHVITGSADTTRSTLRPFELLFFDPQIVAVDRPEDLSVRTWNVRVSAGSDSAVASANRGADRTLLVMVIAVLALGGSVVVIALAVRANMRLAEMRSDFVATVTHELKTPLATIRAVGTTLIRGRLLKPDALLEYAQLLVQEARRLTRLVDNLLAYARVTDVTELYSFERLAPGELIVDAVHEFRHPIVEGGFEVQIEVPMDLPLVRADRTAMQLALDNLLDNAIRYASVGRWIYVGAWHDRSRLYIEIRDRGTGIPAEELAAVQRKFVRGRSAPPGGSGLGLAIVHRIIADHGGTFVLTSEVGVGTTARLDLLVIEG